MFTYIKQEYSQNRTIIEQQPMQNIDLSSLVQVKLDFSVVQDALSLTMQDIFNRIAKLEAHDQKINQTTQHMQAETQKLYELIQQYNERNGQTCKQLQDKIDKINTVGSVTKTISEKVFPEVVDKTPKEVLDHIENRLQLNLNLSGAKQMDMNCSPPNTDRVCQTFRVKDNLECATKTNKEELDQRVYSIYAKAIQKIQEEITQLRNDMKMQLTSFEHKSMKIIDGRLNEILGDVQTELQGQSQGPRSDKDGKASTKGRKESQSKLVSFSKSQKEVVDSTGGVQPASVPVGVADPQSLKNLEESSTPVQDSKQEIQVLLDELKKQVKAELQVMAKSTEQKFDEINRTNSVLADHLVETKKVMQDLIISKDTLTLEMTGMRQKSSTSERQLCLLVDAANDHKNKIKIIENTITKIGEELKQCKASSQVIKEEANEDDQGNSSGASSKKDIFRDSHSSFRSSVGGNLGPIRHNSIVKANSNRIDNMQEAIKQMGSKMSAAIDRLNKMEDDRKREYQQLSGSLPKIDKENKSNVNPLEIIRKELKKVNDDIIKTNQKLTLTKDRLNDLYESHADVPNKIQDLYCKLREYNELQEDRLIQLIKELINRTLSDPFDNNFTNRLKREINVKFLEIRHENNCILKEIQSKVENRAEISEVQKLTQKYEEGILEVKSIANKKCQTEDFKKGIKYLENKIKEVFQFAKSETVALANQQKQYIGAKKQPLH